MGKHAWSFNRFRNPSNGENGAVYLRPGRRSPSGGGGLERPELVWPVIVTCPVAGGLRTNFGHGYRTVRSRSVLWGYRDHDCFVHSFLVVHRDGGGCGPMRVSSP